mmetsp:Transcript_84824/g.166008  ORF Transcript_84824/g.166008 Transcript_84824/m.166008 type:complete len:203 (+) Transcript_84824:44-652(+)
MRSDPRARLAKRRANIAESQRNSRACGVSARANHHPCSKGPRAQLQGQLAFVVRSAQVFSVEFRRHQLVIPRVVGVELLHVLLHDFAAVRIGLLVSDARPAKALNPFGRLPRGDHVDDPLRDQPLHVRAGHEEQLEDRLAGVKLLSQHVASNVGLRADEVFVLRAVRVLGRAEHDSDRAVLHQAHPPILQKVPGRHTWDAHG